MTLWIKVTKDKYELPEAVADSVDQLAKMLGIPKNTIYSSISHAKKKGFNSIYRKVEIKDGEI